MRKLCINCNVSFEKPYKYSAKQWEKRSACSVKCQHENQKKVFSGKHFSPDSEFSGWDKSKNHPSWKGGRTFALGYVYVHVKNHPNSHKGYVAEHRLVMEKSLGRYLDKTEVVHHINEIKDDNRIENLMLLENQSVHARLHKLENVNV